jgi:excisionase family DNA binding protein
VTALLNKEQAAEVLGISVPTLERLVSKRKVVALKPSPKCVRFRPVDLERYLTETANRRY